MNHPGGVFWRCWLSWGSVTSSKGYWVLAAGLWLQWLGFLGGSRFLLFGFLFFPEEVGSTPVGASLELATLLARPNR